MIGTYGFPELGAKVVEPITEQMRNVPTESEESDERKSSPNDNKIEDKMTCMARRRSMSIPNASEADASDSEGRALPYKWWSSGI